MYLSAKQVLSTCRTTIDSVACSPNAPAYISHHLDLCIDCVGV